MQTYGEGRNPQPAKSMMRPPVVIAIGVCGLLAVGVLVKHFRGSSSEELTPSPRSSASVVRGGKPDGKHAANQRAGGWIAQPGVGGPLVANGESGSAGMLAGNRAGNAADAEAASGSAAAVSAGSSAGSAGQVRGSAGASPEKAATGQGASAAGPASSTGDAALIQAAQSVQNANPVAGSGNAPSLGRNPTHGSEGPPAAPEQGAPLVELAQPPGGSTLVYQNAANKDLPMDKLLHVDAQNFVGRDTGAVSFFLQPQWQANDPTNATLVQLGNSDTNPSGFAITKDGQSLHFIFADNSGATPLDASVSIDGWKPGEQHLVTASWGQSQDGGHSVASFYVDGQLVGQQQYNGQFQIGQGVPLNIGSGYGNPAQVVPGVLNNFKVYNQAPPPWQLGQAAKTGSLTK